MARRYVPRPTHFAFGPKGSDRDDSPCGIYIMWHRGLKYTREPLEVTCRHCLRWLRKEALRLAEARKAATIEGTARPL